MGFNRHICDGGSIDMRSNTNQTGVSVIVCTYEQERSEERRVGKECL